MYMAHDDVVLEMRNIEKAFPGVKALDNASLRVEKGQIHALIGENGAGKSTLMKILLGMYSADAGEILYKGQPVAFKEPYQALSSGISMIHQEVSLIPTVDVSENIWLGREKKFLTGGFLNTNARYKATVELLEYLKLDINPKTIVHELSIANMQLVELARAVSYHSELVIMDEPTSSLTSSEVELLYNVIRDLSSRGTAIIFISHKLEEIFEICSHVTVMRDGKYVSDHATSDITTPELISKIAGRDITDLFPKEHVEIGKTVLEVKNLSSGNVFRDVNFEVHAGEILGFCGLVGAGRTEIMRAVFGIDKSTSGDILINGVKVNIRSPEDAINNGLAMVTEDRLHMGIISNLSVGQNISLAYLRTISSIGFVGARQEGRDVQEMIEQMGVRTPSAKQKIAALSGGNQQKAILARWLLTKPKILILDEPTRGIDVRSKSEIHGMISKLAKDGLAVIMISSEMPEILGMSDRIIVVREGRLTANLPRAGVDQELLLNHAFGTI